MVIYLQTLFKWNQIQFEIYGHKLIPAALDMAFNGSIISTVEHVTISKRIQPNKQITPLILPQHTKHGSKNIMQNIQKIKIQIKPLLFLMNILETIH